ncbi:MAG: AMP-binding protein [Fibromonadaceae bacterium]|jgi:long-chain acyl-CoA synthetase|nr:AMP-binding protein [Fibromonadaceae bacterium]
MFKATDSLPVLALAAFNRPGFKGFFHRTGEEWVCYDSKNLQDSIYFFSLALKKIGIGKGVGVGIIAPSSPKWFIVDIATQVCGGYVVPLFSNISSEYFEFQIKDAQIKALAVESGESLSSETYNLASEIDTLVYMFSSPKNSGHKNSFSWEDFIEIGKKMDCEDERKKFTERINSIAPEEIFSIIYTSGSTGTPKGVPLTQKNMILHLDAISEIFPLDPDNNIHMSILPVAHVFERMSVYYFSSIGLPVYFADSPNNVGKYLPEIKPTVLTVVPRVLEKLYDKLTGAAREKHGPVKWLMKYAINKAKNADPSKVSLRGTIWDKLVYSKMRNALGGRFSLIVSGSSALNISVNRFLRNIGLPIFEGYGMTECSPVISAENPGNAKMGSVGKPISCITAKISEEGEILVKGESVFSGYFNRPDLNSEIFTEDGFFHTGDKGRIDEDGYIWITGRLKEMFKTSTGKYVSPIPIEQALCQSTSLIEAAQVFAEGKKFTSALLFLNVDIVKSRLKKSHVEFNPEKALKSNRINAFLQKNVDAVNRHLSDWEKIKKWEAVFATLTTENGLLTPTMKLRRSEVEKTFESKINGMYE